MQLRAAALGLALAAAASVPACEDPAPSRSAESGPPRAAAPAPRPTPSDARPNVLLVTVDTLRADFLGTYGFEADDSPHVDAFAATGVVFERAIAASSATAPAHASIMTSRYTREHSIGYANGGARLTDETRLAQLFREAGYRTGAFVGNAVLAAGTGFETGFDIYDDRLPTPERNRPIVFERLAPDTTRRAIAWASSAPDDEPFFLWVHYQDPHAPYTPPPAYTGRIRLEPRPDERPLPLLDSNSGWGGVPRYGVVADAQLLSEYKSRYAEEILSMDAAFGTLLAAVDSHASGRDAVVLLTADHGEALGEGDRYFVHRHTTTPEVAHVPFVLRAPGLAAGRRRDLVHHVDVLPTLLELAGIGVPEDARGVALGPLLRQEAPVPQRTVFCDAGHELAAYRRGGFVRVRDALAPWQPTRPEEGDWFFVRYRWAPGGAWVLDPSNEPLEEPVRAYAAHAKPLAVVSGIDPELFDALEALGYVDDGIPGAPGD